MSIERMQLNEDIPARCVKDFGAMEVLDLANGAQVLFN